MRPPGWILGAARSWPYLLAGLAVASLAFVPFRRPAAPGASLFQDPVALLRRGLQILQTGEGDPFAPLEEGLSRIRRSADAKGFEFPALVSALRSAAERETDPERIARLAGIAGAILSLVPGAPLDPGDLWLRAGRPWEAARAWLRAAQGLDAPAAVRILRGAAEALSRAGFFLPAAELYGTLRDRNPGDTEFLFRRADCLARAGLWDPDALEAFGLFVDRVRPGDPLLPRALLSRGALLADLGRIDEALRDFDRLLGDPALGIDPRTEEWSEALRRRGLVLLEAAEEAPPPRRQVLRRGARQAFEEYLERYAAEGPLPSRGIEAGIGLVRVRLAENEWGEALERMNELLSRLPSPLPEEVRGPVLELRLLRGEVLLLLGRKEEAAEAFGAAARRAGSDPARLGGILGRARALQRLGRKEEARGEIGRARAVFESEASLPGAALSSGFGRDYWRGELEAASREVP